MSKPYRLKRRLTGASGPPGALLNGELAFNEVDNGLYYGKGVAADGCTATSVIKINGTTIVNGGGSSGPPTTIENPYALPVSGPTTLGGVKVGPNSGLTLLPDGTLSVPANTTTPVVPIASNTVLGGIKVGPGSGLALSSDGHLTTDINTTPPTFPVASSTVLGGFRVGIALTINPTTGVMSVPIGSASTLGVYRIGAGLVVDPTTGTLSVDGTVTGGGGGGGSTIDPNALVDDYGNALVDDYGNQLVAG